MIDDPDDEKPANWVDVAKIEDPAAKKPGLGFRVYSVFRVQDSGRCRDPRSSGREGEFDLQQLINN